MPAPTPHTKNATPSHRQATDTTWYAHSPNDHGDWHPLSVHLAGVANRAQNFAAEFEMHESAHVAGLLHDLGKYGTRFQRRLRGEGSGLDHWSAGAWIALLHYHLPDVAAAIVGHHIGLQTLDKPNLAALAFDKLNGCHPLGLSLSDEADYELLLARLQLELGLPPVSGGYGLPHPDVGGMLDVRMLFSTLVDADFLDTEAHFKGDAVGKRFRDPGPKLDATNALAAVLAYRDAVRSAGSSNPRVAEIRDRLWQDCMEAAVEAPGIRTLTAPTGSGKTWPCWVLHLRMPGHTA